MSILQHNVNYFIWSYEKILTVKNFKPLKEGVLSLGLVVLLF